MRDNFCELIQDSGKARPGNRDLVGERDRHNRMNVNE